MKLDVDFRNYRILGAYNPPFAYKALQAEDKIGTMFPATWLCRKQPGESGNSSGGSGGVHAGSEKSGVSGSCKNHSEQIKISY